MAAPVPLAVPQTGALEKTYVNEALLAKQLSWRGEFVEQFEEALSTFLGKPSLTTSSGMGAIQIALHALGVGPGDEVIVPVLTFPGTASAVMSVGARPVPVDVRWDTWGMDPKQVAERISHRTKAIMPVHLYGMDAGDFSGFGLPVIEDACEAFGMVEPRCQPFTVYSFFANKTLTTGEGGAICGDVERARPWRNGGFDGNYSCIIPGLNYRMGNLQAAVGCAQMRKINPLLRDRLANAKWMTDNIGGKGKWLFCPSVPSPQAAIRELAEHGIETRPIFMPLHKQPAFKMIGRFDVAEAIWRTHISVPTGPHVTVEDRLRIKDAIWRHRHGYLNVCTTGGGNRELASPCGPDLHDS